MVSVSYSTLFSIREGFPARTDSTLLNIHCFTSGEIHSMELVITLAVNLP